jgi:hypothetical protein
MKQVALFGGLLAVSLVGSYLTWTAEDTPDVSEGVTVVAGTGLTEIAWAGEKKDIQVVQDKDDKGAFFRVTFTERKEVTKPPPAPEPEPEPAEGEEAEGEEAEGETEETEPEEAPEPEVEIEETTKVFTGNASAEELWEAFTPLRGLRQLSISADTDLASFGLVEPEATLTLTGGVELKVGAEAYGTRDRYVSYQGNVFLIDDKTLRPLQFANTRLVERRLHGIDEADIETVQVVRGSDTRVLVQKNADDRAKAYWADRESPDDKDIEAGTWLGKMFKLRAQSYVDTADAPAQLTPVFTFAVSGDGESWQVEILSGDKDGQEAWYARSDFTRSLTQLTRSLAQEAIADLDTFFDGEPAEEEGDEGDDAAEE